MKNETRVIRIMTNTAALIQQSVSVYSKGTYATDGKYQLVNESSRFCFYF